MSPVLLKMLKALGSELLMKLLEFGMEELKSRDDNTVKQEDVDKIASIRANNIFPKDEANV